MRTSPTRHLRLLAVLPLFWHATAAAQSTAEVTYKHHDRCPNTDPLPDGCAVTETVTLTPGGTLTVWIKQTRLSLFTVRYLKVVRQEAPGDKAPLTAQVEQGAFAKPPEDSLPLEIVHSAKYAGYVITIAPTGSDGLPKDAGPRKVDGKDVPAVRMPAAATIVVIVNAPDAPYRFSGGISVARGVSNPRFIARAKSPTEPGLTIQRDTIGEDAATVGFATFVHVRPWVNARVWPGIGIGLESSGRTQYYFGLGWQVSDGIFINGGAVLGRISELPLGLRLNDPITDPNQLANLTTRSKWGFFLGMSFAFLGGGKATFAKPFAGPEK